MYSSSMLRARALDNRVCTCEHLVLFYPNNAHLFCHTCSYYQSLLSATGRTTIETRTRIIHLLSNGFTVKNIVEKLAEEGVEILCAAIYNLIKKFKEHDSIADMRKTPRPRILQEEHYRFIDDMMAENGPH